MYKAATLPSLSSLLTLTPVSATKQAGTDGSFSTDLAPLSYCGDTQYVQNASFCLASLSVIA